MDETDKIKLDLLVKQSDGFGSAITSLMLLSERVIGVGSSIVLAALAVAVKEKAYEVVLILPVPMFALYFYFVNLHTAVLEMGGYKKRLEEQINELVGRPLYLWETALVSQRHANLANIFLAIIFGLILLLFIAASLYVAYSYPLRWVFYTQVSTNTIFLIGLVVSIKRMTTAFARTYVKARDLSESSGGIPS